MSNDPYHKMCQSGSICHIFSPEACPVISQDKAAQSARAMLPNWQGSTATDSPHVETRKVLKKG